MVYISCCEHLIHTSLEGILVHLVSGKLPPAFCAGLWRPVEAADTHRSPLQLGLTLSYDLGEHAPGTLSAWARSPQELSFGPAPALLTRCVLGRLAEHLRTKPAVVPVGRVLTVLSCGGTD